MAIEEENLDAGLMGPAAGTLDRLSTDLKRARRLAAPVIQAAERWELRTLRQRLSDLAGALGEASAAVQRAQAELAALTLPTSGPAIEGWVREVEQAAREQHLDLKGAFPEYEVFPLTVKAELEREQVVVGHKRLATLRPRPLMAQVARDVKRLTNSGFNAQRFMRDLVLCHGYVRATDPKPGRGASLAKILRLMQLGPGTYSRQDFIFDIFRLRRESNLVYGDVRLVFLHARGAPFFIPSARGSAEPFTTLELQPVDGDA